MAFVENQQQDDEKKQPAQGAVSPTGGGGAVHLAPSSGVVSGSSGAPSTGGASGAPAGGQFATLNQYINANQGQAAPLAGKITGGIQKQYNDLDSQNQAINKGISDQVAAGTPNVDPNTLSAEAANPVSFASDPNNVKAFQGLMNAKYTGPQSVEGTSDYQNQQANINNAISEGQAATQTDAGRQQLVGKVSARPTAGVTALNSAILSQDPNYLGQVENAYKPFGSLVSNLSSSAGDIDKTIAANSSATSNASQAANKAIADQISGLQKGVDSGVTDATAKRDAYNSAIAKGQSEANSDNSQLLAAQQADIPKAVNTAKNFSNAYQAPAEAFANKYLTPTASLNSLIPWLNNNLTQVAAPTAATTATADQYATDAALGKLAGSSYTPVLDPNNASQAGSYVVPNAPAAIGNVPGELNYMSDLTNVLSNPGVEWANPGAINGDISKLTPQQLAQNIQRTITGNNGYNNVNGNPAYMKSLQNLIDNMYGI